MGSSQYLKEEKFQEVNDNIKSKGRLITNVFLGLGILLIFTGIFFSLRLKSDKVKHEYEYETKLANLEKEKDEELNNLKDKLIRIQNDLNIKKKELINKGIEKSSDYNKGEAYDLFIIDNALDPSFSHCSFDQYINNNLTKDYCTLTNVITNRSHDYSCEDNAIIKKYCDINNRLNVLEENAEFEENNYPRIPFFIIGFMLTFISLMAKYMLFMITNRREILAYQTQQAMPIAKEGIEKIAPSAGIAAEEITKGIKRGLKDKEK